MVNDGKIISALKGVQMIEGGFGPCALGRAIAHRRLLLARCVLAVSVGDAGFAVVAVMDKNAVTKRQ